LRQYREIWLVDFEYHAPDGEVPYPLVVVARELLTDRLIRQRLADGAPSLPPYPTDSGALFVAYGAQAEMSCHLSLNWPPPQRIFDLYAAFREMTAGLNIFPDYKSKYSLLRALEYFDLDRLSCEEKEKYRELAINYSGSLTEQQWADLTDYCQTDVDALARLLPKLLPRIGRW
jgi:hypothetical protein